MARVFKKERNRDSFEIPQLQKKFIATSNHNLEMLLKRKEKIIYANRIERYRRNFKESECTPMFLLLTNRNIILITMILDPGTKKMSPQANRLSPDDIESIELSTMKDKFCLLKFSKPHAQDEGDQADSASAVPPIFFRTNYLSSLIYGFTACFPPLSQKLRYNDYMEYELKKLKGFKGAMANTFTSKTRKVEFIQNHEYLIHPITYQGRQQLLVVIGPAR